jgi:1-acyl-sn-glycerol-3-phosphate acyltransferase
VIVANHQSFLDINVLWPAIGNAAFMAKASLWKAPIFGWVISTIGCIPVHKNPRKNAGMGKMVAERLAKGYNFTVFPEGHRTEDGHMLKFQNGIFRMAKEQRFDILPVTLVNTGEILPKVKWSIRGGEVKIVVHPMVKGEDYADKPMGDLRDELHDLIESAMPYKQQEIEAAKGNAKEA